MTVVLAMTWNPRGEIHRFRRLLPRLMAVYARLVITLPPHVEPGVVAQIAGIAPQEAEVYQTSSWPLGRHLALSHAAAAGCDAVHYADCDRLLRWVETRPDEWRATVAQIQAWDCLLIGRTPAAYQTHPHALVLTEAISNQVISSVLGMPVDASAGSKGFSQPAAAYLAAHAVPDAPFGTDAEWPILLQRAGFRLGTCLVDGLDWESADRYQDQAAGPERQRQAAAAYDADPQNWAARTRIAQEIVQAALRAAQRPLEPEHF